jgi:hypothetical protein
VSTRCGSWTLTASVSDSNRDSNADPPDQSHPGPTRTSLARGRRSRTRAESLPGSTDQKVRWSSSAADEPGLVRVDHGLDAIAQVELHQDPADMGLDRRLGHIQFRRNLCVGQPTG